MRYRVERIERAVFSELVREHHVECRVAPWDDEVQRLATLEIALDPGAELASHRDCFGNQVHRAALLGAHTTFELRMTAEVETRLTNPFDFDVIPPSRERHWVDESLRQAPRIWDLVLHRSALTPELGDLFPNTLADCEPAHARSPTDPPALRPGMPLLAQMQGACAWVQARLDYAPGQPPATRLTDMAGEDAGAAADLAHLLIVIARSWRLPARFVSGYLDPGYFEGDAQAGDGPRAQTLHHWMEALIPGAGWRGFDPAHGLIADATYIRQSVGRDLADVDCIRQTFKGEGEVSGRTSEIDIKRLDP
jgi:transglutaminase-like putative cysteine protease